MNGKIKKSHGNRFKLKVALEAFKMNKTMSELCQEFAITSSQIYAWKKQLEDRGIEAFLDKRKSGKKEFDEGKLHAIIGKLFVELESLAQYRSKRQTTC